jgi:voltage-dependent calcium channel T type alpha-1G
LLDFTIVFFSVLALFYSSGSDYKILRILRVLRPLRLISKIEGLKLAINSLVMSIPRIFNLIVVCLMFFFLFGIFGVNFFKGK